MALGTREEGDNIFGSASMTPITITLLVRNSQTSGECKILYKDIGDNLKKHEKLNWLEHYSSVGKITRISNWERITPNKRSEWINKGSESFFKFAGIIDKSNKGLLGIFKNYSVGVKSNRDHWVVNFSPTKAKKNAERLIKNFNEYLLEGTKLERISQNSHKVKWSGNLMDRYRRGIYLSSKQQETVTMLFRPFTKAIFVNNREIIERYYRNEQLFPDPDSSNLVIAISGPGSLSGFSVIMSDRIVNLSVVAAAQCFPLKLFARQDGKSTELFTSRGTPHYIETAGLTNEGLQYFQTYYKRSEIRRDDLFYYIYGLLHSLEYRKLFANNLRKELPRIPTVKNFNDFRAFSKAGRKLGDLHVNYESVEPYHTQIKEGGLDLLSPSIDPVDFYRVSRMRFGGNRSFQDRSTVVYNNNITLENIPLEAYDYVVNGKPALKWVMEQQCERTDSKSGITNDANDYANEVMKDPAYPLRLFQRVITVSLETLRIVHSLPKLNID